MKKSFIFVLAILMVTAFSMPVMAADEEAPMWNFYGSARMATWYDNVSDGASSVYGDSTIVSSGDDSDAGTIWDLQSNSRFGATVKGETIGGGFEYGTGVNLRKLFGTYTMGDSEFLVGQTYTPLASMFYSNQAFGVDAGLLNVGNIYTGRDPMLQWKMKGLRLALVKPQVDDLGIEGVDADSVIPQFEGRYNFSADTWFFDVFGGINAYDLEAPEKDRTLTAWNVGIGAGVDMGAFYGKGMIWVGENVAQLGAWLSSDGGAGINRNNNNLNDNEGLGAMVALGFKASDSIAIEAGYGYTNFEYADTIAANNGYDTDDMQAIYINAIIDIVPGFFIVPEFGYYDFMEGFGDDDQGSETYFGAKWQINF